jgi:two-component sensor histidine kinase
LGDQLDKAPALMLGFAGALGLVAQKLSHRGLSVVERRHRRWNWILLSLMLLCAAVNIAAPGPLVNVLPDYLVLGVFCVTLYYKERLVFFDLLIKRGAFFALALVGLTLFFVVGPRVLDRFPLDWSRPWITALLLTPFWLMGPWIYERLAQAIDRVWLRRRYSPADAERQFARDVQIAVTEKDLQSRAERSLKDIFQATAEVQFNSAPAPEGISAEERNGGLHAELEQRGARLGSVLLGPRTNCIPYMSDDRRLFQSVARTLSVVLENIRFREQQQRQEEREQELRWLASRAELKALRAQINPHFLFNALNAIAGLIQDQPQLADETVEQLAHVFRYTLRKSEKEWVRLDEEIEFVSAYLRVEQARFGQRLRVELNVDPAAAAIPVPAMSIQPLVENAIKHGVSAIESRGVVGLRVMLKGEALWVEVFDNGPGFAPDFSMAASVNGSAPPGYGLRNVIERLRGYYGDQARLHWENGRDGTRVVLEIPYLRAPDFVGTNQP